MPFLWLPLLQFPHADDREEHLFKATELCPDGPGGCPRGLLGQPFTVIGRIHVISALQM